MIRLYPSGLEGEPLETHVIEAPILLVDWLKQQAPDFSLEREHPICIKVGGELLPVVAWAEFVVRPETDVRIYPEPRASAGGGGLGCCGCGGCRLGHGPVHEDARGIAARPGRHHRPQPAKANRAKVNEPVREILGRYKVYPDYVVQPVSRFVNERELHTSLCLCVGAGSHVFLPSSIKIGDTAGCVWHGCVVRHYNPGESLAGDTRAENWYSVGRSVVPTPAPQAWTRHRQQAEEPR